jgi:hypothetical protein
MQIQELLERNNTLTAKKIAEWLKYDSAEDMPDFGSIKATPYYPTGYLNISR